MSAQEPGPQVEPHIDPPPDEGPGGPADMVHLDEDTAVTTPDQPRSAQVEEDEVPDEIEQPEDLDEEEKDTDPQAEKTD